MNYRQQLNELIQDKIGQCVPFRYTKQTVGDKFAVNLIIANASFSSCSADTIINGKEATAQQALCELQPLNTEAEVRQRLGLPMVTRHPCINIIRLELRQVRQQLKRKGKQSVFAKLAKIYPCLDWVEQELTAPYHQPTCQVETSNDGSEAVQRS